jgi:extracellular elastinolytic metalloproteinase
MSLRAFACALSTAAVLALTSTALAEGAAPFSAPEVRIARATSSKGLTGTSRAATIDIVRGYLRAQGHSQATLDSLALVSEGRSSRTGVTHARFVQRVQGLDVYGVYVKASVDVSGQLTSIIENLVPVRSLDKPAGGEEAALASALRHLYGGAVAPPGLIQREGNRAVFARSAFFYRGPRVTSVAVPFGAAQLRVGFVVETWSAQDNLLHETLVGGDNSVIAVEQRTNTDSYFVFKKSPTTAAQETVDGPGSGNLESPSGWLGLGGQTTVNISGNNVHAYLDTDANNLPDAGGTSVTNGSFLTSANLSAQPSTTANKAVAVQNLFYLNNVIHDALYDHGFHETAGNFQINNFGNGGLGNDPVNAEAQDGSGSDNANFATPSDGLSPRMQMYLWTGTGTHQVVVNSPAAIAGNYLANGSSLGPALTTTGITGDVVLVNDGSAPNSDGCQRLARNSLTGKIALIDRGTCTFADKIVNAQRAGAIAAIVANNAGDGLITMGGSGSVTIASVFVGYSTGQTLRSVSSVNARLKLADTPPLSRDGDVDSDIVYHEYGHGLTWRMIGSMGGVMSGAIGEGMSDVLAVLMNGDDKVGEYSSFDPNGIRTAPYANYPRTYKSFSGTEVHLDGEIYGAIGWRLGELYATAGLTTGDLLDDLVDGMNYTPANPKFEQMRDGILQAVTAATLGHECLVWRGFAKYGVGVGASASIRGTKVTIKESFNVPAGCPAP